MTNDASEAKGVDPAAEADDLRGLIEWLDGPAARTKTSDRAAEASERAMLARIGFRGRRAA